MNKYQWNTYRVSPYQGGFTRDHPSAGGVVLSQIRLANHQWSVRRLQSNAGQVLVDPVITSVTDDLGERLFDQAVKFAQVNPIPF